MTNWHLEKFTIDDTYVGHKQSVPITELMKMFEIATFKHSNKMGLDHVSMKNHSNAFWVVTKMKVILNSPICINDQVRVLTFTRELGSVRALRDCIIKVKNFVKAKFLAEWCCLDFETRKLRRLNTICYPDLQMEKTNYVKTEFTNFKENVEEKDFVYSRYIRSTDIDVNNHTNNLKYNYIALDAFSTEELNSFDIKEYEIYFVNESYEGDKIDIFKKKIKNYYYIEGRVNKTIIFRTVIKTKNK